MADSTWGTAEVKQALAEITPAVNGTAPIPTGRPKNEDALKLAREAGWVQPTSYNYDAKAPVTVLNGEEVEPQPEAGVGDSSFSKPQTLRRMGATMPSSQYDSRSRWTEQHKSTRDSKVSW